MSTMVGGMVEMVCMRDEKLAVVVEQLTAYLVLHVTRYHPL